MRFLNMMVCVGLSVAVAGAALCAEVPSQQEIRIESPADRAVFQRNDHAKGRLPIRCKVSVGTVDLRVLDKATKAVVKDWFALTAAPEKGSFAAELELASGWYQLEFRAMNNGVMTETAKVEHVGIGEVFVTAGQSNSANHGRPTQVAKEDRVSTCDYKTGLWQHCADPQPAASGRGGSPWPLLGDLLVQKFKCPVGFICVGVGSTAVGQWATPTGCYPRLKMALQRVGKQGCRAVLWHQGESDSIAGTPAEGYAKKLTQVIEQSRQDAGWQVPWGVALASFHPSPVATPERQQAVIEGQKLVLAKVAGVFHGPETDSFHTRGFLGDSVHFNAQGLAAHAQGWADALNKQISPLKATAVSTGPGCARNSRVPE
ncbi:MAG: sialate O-acetylesterase [bacterium]